MTHGNRHEEVVVAALRRLSQTPAATPLNVRLLAGGLSGSSVYRLDLAGEDVVLKVTLPSERRQVKDRACREVVFYQELATQVPVLVPRVLGIDRDEVEGIVILLAAYAPSPPLDQWAEDDYAEVSRQLGQFHATFWDNPARMVLPEWLRTTPPVTLAQCRDAARLWRVLGERDDLHDVVESSLRQLERLVIEVPELERRMFILPATLCHGDFHIDNLLRGPRGEWVWADWQEVRLGPGENDLAFLWQRAFVAAETAPPYDTMVQAYRVGLERTERELIDGTRLDRALAWAELRSWLVDWPYYLGAFLSTTQIARVLRRIETLIDQLEIAG